MFHGGEKVTSGGGDGVLSWKQPFPWDWLSWQKVTARAGALAAEALKGSERCFHTRLLSPERGPCRSVPFDPLVPSPQGLLPRVPTYPFSSK